jgi:ABC-2 type transport system permease protein
MMRKFLAVLKREYFKIVWKKLFIVTTLLAPVGMAAVSFIPVLMLSIKGNAVRIAIVEKDGRFFTRLNESLSSEKQLERLKESAQNPVENLDKSQDEAMKQSAGTIASDFVLEEFRPAGKSLDEIKTELNQRISDEKIEGYLIIPEDIESSTARFEFSARNSSDFVAKIAIERAVNDSVRLERLSKVNISEAKLKEINKKVAFDTKSVDKSGKVKEGSDLGFPIAFALAFLFYITINIYGSMVMGAVVEEKETKIAEILFSSAKPFQLMMGKLTGVCLAGLTQVSIWLASALIAVGSLSFYMNSMGMPLEIPGITPLFIIYFLLFFLMGFFLFSTIFALIGSMVTTTQEGGQFMIFIIVILMAGLYSVIPIVRDPNSTFATIVSFMPFLSPITMPIRIFIESPPFWQIGLAIVINLVTIAGMVWVAARIYRVGLLMYGKRATIPEAWRWIWQA